MRLDDLIAQNRDELLNDPEALTKIEDKMDERTMKKNVSQKSKSLRTNHY